MWSRAGVIAERPCSYRRSGLAHLKQAWAAWLRRACIVILAPYVRIPERQLGFKTPDSSKTLS